MNNRERFQAVLNHQSYDRLPLVHLGFGHERLKKWMAEGRIPEWVTQKYRAGSGNQTETELTAVQGFDFTLPRAFVCDCNLKTPADVRPSELSPESSNITINRKNWREYFLPRLQWDASRVTESMMRVSSELEQPWRHGGLEFLRGDNRAEPLAFFCSNLRNFYRNIIFDFISIGSLRINDSDLLREILDTFADLSCRNLDYALAQGAHFDYLYFVDDVCSDRSPASVETFIEYCGPYYRRFTGMAAKYGINLAIVDCMGIIDELLPVWLDNGINAVMPLDRADHEKDIAV